MANILEYMRRTLPETSREANPKSTRNEIRKEAREYAKYLASAKDTANHLDDNEALKMINKDILFLSEWMIKFGVKDED